MVEFEKLFDEKNLIKKSNKIQITENQLKNFNIWFDLLEQNKLEKETSNYNNFSDYILKGLLNYKTENILNNQKVENVGEVEFCLKNEKNEIFSLIELKGQKNNLDKKQGTGYSIKPIQQASLYADSFKDLNFFVVSNYNKFIFFSKKEKLNKRYELNFLDFKKNKYEKLKVFLYLFSKEYTDNKIIEKEEKEYFTEQKEFSKKFYKLFFETLKLLVFEIEKSNEEINRKKAVFYSQKIMDRLIFTCFAEDNNLLENNFIHKNLLNEIEKENGNLWERLNEMFRNMNLGKENPLEESKSIPKFNGDFFTLDLENKMNINDKRENNFFEKNCFENYKFKSDLSNEIKEKLKPYSKIFYNIFLISNFDFKSDLNVNILGHIFENSLNDIENLKNEEISKRKKDGIFYTPNYITDYICRNTIIPYLSLKENNEVNKLISELNGETKLIENFEKKLTDIKILDPACGSGAFLNKAVEILNEIWESLENLKIEKGWYKTQIKKKSYETFNRFNQKEKIKEIIKNNIFGVDLNSESIEITKLSLFLKISNKQKPKLINLEKNIKCGNSLISGINENNFKLFEDDLKNILLCENKDDKNILKKSLNLKINNNLKEYFGEDYKNVKPFNWEIEFIEIFFKINESGKLERKGFDVVIGNPPYVDYRKIDEKEKIFFSKNFELSKYKKTGSLYIYFIEKSLNLINNNGFLGFINPYQYLSADSGIGIRKILIDKHTFLKIIDVSNIKVFEDVSTYTCLNFFKKNFNKENKIEILRCDKEKDIYKKGFFIEQKKIKENNYLININPNQKILEKIKNDSESLENFCKIFCGTSKTGFNKKIIGRKNYSKLLEKEKEKYNLVLQSSYIQKFSITNFKEYIEKNIYPKNVLENFEKEKIFFARMTKKIRCIFSNKKIFGGKVNILIDFKKLNPKYLNCLLNSKLIDFWYYINFESKHLQGGYLGFDIPSLKIIPIKNISQKEQIPFIEKAEKMLKLNKNFYDKINFYLENLKIDFEIEKISKKLEKFYLLEKNEFLKEIKKISNKKIIEKFYNEFENKKNEILEIKNKIDLEDKIINKMVYEIYGLTNEEIEVVENG